MLLASREEEQLPQVGGAPVDPCSASGEPLLFYRLMSILQDVFIKATDFLSYWTWKQQFCDVRFSFLFHSSHCKISSVDHSSFHKSRKTLNESKFKWLPWTGTCAFRPPLSAPLPPSPSCGFTGLAPAVGGLSVDTPHGGCYPPTGTEVTQGIPTVKPSKDTFRGLQVWKAAFGWRVLIHVSSGLLYSDV